MATFIRQCVVLKNIISLTNVLTSTARLPSDSNPAGIEREITNLHSSVKLLKSILMVGAI